MSYILEQKMYKLMERLIEVSQSHGMLGAPHSLTLGSMPEASLPQHATIALLGPQHATIALLGAKVCFPVSSDSVVGPLCITP